MYSRIVRNHAVNPQGRELLNGANAEGEARYPACGDTFHLQLQVKNDVIVAARFQAQACGPVIAIGSVGCSLLQGQTTEAARGLSAFVLDEALGGLPAAKRHAILLFLESLHSALSNIQLESV